MTFPHIVKISKLCRQLYCIVDSNRALLLTDDKLNITLIKKNNKGNPDENLEKALSPHFSYILEIHDGWKKLKDQKKKERKELKKARKAEGIENESISSNSKTNQSEISAISTNIGGILSGQASEKLISTDEFRKKYGVHDYLYLMKDYYYFLTVMSQIKIIASLKFPEPEKVEIL